MAKFFEEFGKHLLNVALALIVALVFQPIVKGHFSSKFTLLALVGYLTLMLASWLSFKLSDRFRNRDTGGG